MTDETKIPWGSRVRATKRYKRVDGDMPEAGWSVKRLWVEVPVPVDNGIFLGTRNLQNGYVDVYENCFVHESTFCAALVCPSQDRNPIYVPLDALKAVE